MKLHINYPFATIGRTVPEATVELISTTFLSGGKAVAQLSWKDDANAPFAPLFSPDGVQISVLLTAVEIELDMIGVTTTALGDAVKTAILKQLPTASITVL